MKVLEVSSEALFWYWCASVAFGLLLCIFHRVCRAARITLLSRVPKYGRLMKKSQGHGFPPSEVLRQLNDVFLCIIFAAGNLCITYFFNDGVFRLYAFSSAMISSFAAERTIGPWIERAASKSVEFVLSLIGIILIPFRLGIRWLTLPLKKCGSAVSRRFHRILRVIYTRKIFRDLENIKENGLLSDEWGHRYGRRKKYGGTEKHIVR